MQLQPGTEGGDWGLPGRTTSRQRWRVANYCVAIGLLATVVCFTDLGKPDVIGDEASYAVVSEEILDTENWIVPTRYGEPNLAKPPLYFWLTAATHGLFEGDELPHRVWAAAAGVATVCLTVVLGGLLFYPELGLVAGLVLLSNQVLMIFSSHGLRRGVMESGVCLCFVVALLCYVMATSSQRMGVWWWLACGASVGAASMLKPFIGYPMLGLISLHFAVVGWRRGGGSRAGGLVLAWGVAVLVSLPWWVVASHRLGLSTVADSLRLQIVERAVVGFPRHVKGPMYYWTAVSQSGLFFMLSIPAVATALVVAFRAKLRGADGFVGGIALLWLLALSMSKSKLLWYAFPVFPLLAIAISRMLLLPLGKLTVRSSELSMRLGRVGPPAIVLLAIVGSWFLVPVMKTKIDYLDEQSRSRLWRAYQEAAARSQPVALVGFPCATDRHKGFYQKRMSQAVTTGSEAVGAMSARDLSDFAVIGVCAALPQPERARVSVALTEAGAISLVDNGGSIFLLGPNRHEMAKQLAPRREVDE